VTFGFPRPCLTCGVLAEGSRCPTHQAAHDRARNARVDAQRPSTTRRGYDSAWERVRLVVLQRDRWTCHWCGGAARTVDHVVALARGGPRLDPANLVASCGWCNSSRGGRTRRKA